MTTPPPESPRLTVRWGAATDVGRVRTANEDAVLAEPGLFLVADGMGGHAAGDVASSIAVATVRGQLAGSPTASTASVVDAVRLANDSVLRESVANASLRGMGTTVTAAVVSTEPDATRLVLANVGDSRAYLFAGGQLRQLTRDHSYVADLVAAGEISEQEALAHPARHVVTRALGVEPEVAVDTWVVTPESGDRFLLCSDGLTNEVDDDSIGEILSDHPNDPQAAADALVAAANRAGGRDNITVVVLDATSDGPGLPPLVLATDTPGLPAPDDPTPTAPTRRFAVVDQVNPPARPPTSADTTDGAVGGWLDPQVADEFDTVAAPPAPRSAAGLTVAAPSPAPAHRRGFPWRSLVFGVAVAVIIGAAFVGIFVAGRSGHYVGFAEDGHVTIYQGRPGGVLWIEPTAKETSTLSRDDLTGAYQDRVSRNPAFSSLEAAQRYVAELEANPSAVISTVEVSPTTTVAGGVTTAVPTVAPGPPTSGASP